MTLWESWISLSTNQHITSKTQDTGISWSLDLWKDFFFSQPSPPSDLCRCILMSGHFSHRQQHILSYIHILYISLIMQNIHYDKIQYSSPIHTLFLVIILEWGLFHIITLWELNFTFYQSIYKLEDSRQLQQWKPGPVERSLFLPALSTLRLMSLPLDVWSFFTSTTYFILY